MGGNIKNFNFNKLDLRLNDSEYYDFWLAEDEFRLPPFTGSSSGDSFVVWYDFNNDNIFSTGTTSADTIYSLVTWDDATNTGYTFDTIGLTGLDNGLIPFNNASGDTTNTGLTQTLTGSTLIITSGDTRLCLNAVNGISNEVLDTSINYVFNGDFLSGVTFSMPTGWFGTGWLRNASDRASVGAGGAPPSFESRSMSQILTTPLSAGNRYQLNFDAFIISSGLTFSTNLSAITQTYLSATTGNTYIIDLTNESTPLSSITFTSSGFGTTSSEIDNVAIYELVGDSLRCYDITLTSDTSGQYANFCGGFYQGYYNIDGYDYEVLPNRTSDGWSANFWLRKDDNCISGCTGDTLNDLYPDNKGFFFYMGTRAENKFWNIFDGNSTGCTSGCTSTLPCTGTVSTLCTVPKETDISIVGDYGVLIPLSPPPIDISVINNQFLIYGRADGTGRCTACGSSSTTNPNGFGTYNVCDFTGGSIVVTSIRQTKETGEETNPFLIYGRADGTGRCTACGSSSTTNPSGYGTNTVCTFSGFTSPLLELDKDADIVDNALGFRIKDDGSIGYRLLTMTSTCVGDVTVTGCSVEEAYSASGMVTDGQWTNIAIRFVPDEIYTPIQVKCGDRRIGKLMFYVDSKLKFVVDNFDEFIAKRLEEYKDKELTVPFNISLGGGSQGLFESMTFDGQDPADLGLKIEENFAGTFIGDISQFKLFITNQDWCDITNLYDLDKNRYQT